MQNSILLRLETLTAFTLLLKGAGKAATEQILKDLMKQLRTGLVDKALVIRIASAQVSRLIFRLSSPVDSLIISVYKQSSNMLPKHFLSMMLKTYYSTVSKHSITQHFLFAELYLRSVLSCYYSLNQLQLLIPTKQIYDMQLQVTQPSKKQRMG